MDQMSIARNEFKKLIYGKRIYFSNRIWYFENSMPNSIDYRIWKITILKHYSINLLIQIVGAISKQILTNSLADLNKIGAKSYAP
jgi:hypothetical protein